MLLKLNEGEGVTVQANHSDVSNSYCINNFEGKVIQCREFPSGDNPPKSEQGDSKNSSQAVQQLKAEISATVSELEDKVAANEPVFGLVSQLKLLSQKLSAD